MRTATSLVVRTTPFPHTQSDAPAPGQYPLPLRGIPAATVEPPRSSATPAGTAQQAIRFTQALVEVLSGGRPLRQVASWMAPEVYDGLQRRLALGAGRGPVTRARLASVHTAVVEPGVLEVAARMVHAQRSRAVAVRLEHHTDRRGVRQWRCTALSWA